MSRHLNFIETKDTTLFNIGAIKIVFSDGDYFKKKFQQEWNYGEEEWSMTFINKVSSNQTKESDIAAWGRTCSRSLHNSAAPIPSTKTN